MSARAILILTVVCALIPPAPAQTTWTRFPPAASPFTRGNHAMAYDSSRGQIVLFGGWAPDISNSIWFGDTWIWDGAHWFLRVTSIAPAARIDHAMAYDAARNRVVLFGGQTKTSFLNDTWEWDGTSWAQRSPATVPPALYQHAMAYDSVRGRVVMFGGLVGLNAVNDTWEWDGGNWTRRSPAIAPPARGGHGMDYDSANGVTVLFGGVVNNSYFADTWEWNGTSWLSQSPATSPGARQRFAMAYNAHLRRVVLFGGLASNLTMPNDTWEWDSRTSSWSQQSPVASPGGRWSTAMAYDGANQRNLLFGGRGAALPTVFADTWRFDSMLASYSLYGSSCPGTFSTLPALSISAPPIMGLTFTLNLSGARPTTTAWLLHGFSKKSWGGWPLPLDLRVIGAPQCTLYNSGDFTVSVATNRAGFASVQIPIPVDVNLLGLRFYDQFVAYDPLANPLGLTTSQGGAGVLGSR